MAYRTVGVRVSRVPEITCLRCGQTQIPEVTGAQAFTSDPPFELLCQGYRYPEGWLRFSLPLPDAGASGDGTRELFACVDCRPVVAQQLAAAVRELDRGKSSVTDADPDGPGLRDDN